MKPTDGLLFVAFVIAVVLVVCTAFAQPAGWEPQFLDKYGGLPTTRVQAVAKLTAFAQNQPAEMSAYLVEKLAASKAGRQFLAQMSNDMDRYAKARIGSGFKGTTKTALTGADASFGLTPDTIISGQVTDPTNTLPTE